MADDSPAGKALSKVPLLERKDLTPRDRSRIGIVVAWLLSAGLAAVAVLGVLTIWHLVRRGRLIREGLRPPRVVGLLPVEKPRREPAGDQETPGDG